MKKTMVFVFVMSCFQPMVAQDAMTMLIMQNQNDSTILHRIEQFRKGGYEKALDYGTHTREEFIATAKTYLGTPYQYGGTTTKGMDCSGLIFRTFRDLGLKAPHGAQALARYGEIMLDKGELLPGDVIFFTNTYPTNKLVTHAAFVVAGGLMIHASTSKGVQITPIDDPYYWNEHYLFGTRIFAPALDIPVPNR
ncbi:C40 family peptidase [Reichenbachiella carrageenanivorans]|uniref:C40 family peptidase n=1 Tax=Reichenbachiella carrageenanivorans TaxID=2979869 RepID=A0ABY6CXM2_9BACT|nr:C40 family peptidase [Reichenbachiella carrageenanivorans]UXX78666.1 C40 family peptidase [Reichenbachiella carrageenanivorans]